MATSTGNKVTIGVSLAILSLVISYGFIGQTNVYTCESRQIAMKCDKLSSGIGTRCYYTDELDKKEKYKICNEGWVKFENEVDSINISKDKKYFICQQTENNIIEECLTDKGERILRVGIK